MVHKCFYCERVFKRKKSYEKHEAMCKLLKEELSENRDETTSALDVYELTNMVRMLVKQNEKLVERVKKLEDNSYKKKVKIDIAKHLDMYSRSKYTLNEWIQNIEINKDDIDDLLCNNLKNSLIKVIKKYYDDDAPILCFIQKKNTYFVFKDENWEICNEDGFANIINKISNKFFQYVTKNINIVTQQDFYLQVISKITNQSENLNSLIHKQIYKSKKLNFKTFLDIEIQ